MINIYAIRPQLMLLKKCWQLKTNYFYPLNPCFRQYLFIKVGHTLIFIKTRAFQKVLPFVVISLNSQHGLEVALADRFKLYWNRQCITCLQFRLPLL